MTLSENVLEQVAFLDLELEIRKLYTFCIDVVLVHMQELFCSISTPRVLDGYTFMVLFTVL